MRPDRRGRRHRAGAGTPVDPADRPHEGELRCAVRGLTTQLAVPQGFTLSVGGTLAATIGRHSTVGLLDVWLFAVGAGVSFCLLALLSGSAVWAGPAGQVPLARAAVFNVLPIVVIPAATGCAALVPSRPLDFLLGGALAAGLYVILLGLVMRNGRRVVHVRRSTTEVPRQLDQGIDRRRRP